MAIDEGYIDKVYVDIGSLEFAFERAVPLEIYVVGFKYFFAPAIEYFCVDQFPWFGVAEYLEVIISAVAVWCEGIGDIDVVYFIDKDGDGVDRFAAICIYGIDCVGYSL